RGESADALIALLDDFARDRTEHAGCLRLLRILAAASDEDDRIVIEAHIAAVPAAQRLHLADDDGLMDLLLLHGLARLTCLDGDYSLTPHLRVTLLGAAEHLEHTADGTAGVVCDLHECSVLDHMRMTSRSRSACASTWG